jgi:hypothetical protein
MENSADVAPRPEPKSAAIGSRNTPKQYVIPKTTNPAMNAAATISHASPESCLVELPTHRSCDVISAPSVICRTQLLCTCRHGHGEAIRFLFAE